MTGAAALENSPFDLHNTEAYVAWRARKLANRAQDANALIVRIKDITHPDVKEMRSLLTCITSNNMVIYSSGDVDKSALRKFGQRMGLERLDGNLCSDEDSITSLQVVNEGRHKGYIPYSNRPLSWHTDGYYNDSDHQIRGILLHCVRAAQSGGENELLDHELLYIQLRDQDPALIAALMRDDAMTIPGNSEEGQEIRGAETGPVFSLDARGNLHMRYSARQRNIIWHNDNEVQRAKDRILELLQESNPYILRYCLQPGEGVLCNNVLHNRTGFTDSEDAYKKRLLFRARYFDRIANTDVAQ